MIQSMFMNNNKAAVAVLNESPCTYLYNIYNI